MSNGDFEKARSFSEDAISVYESVNEFENTDPEYAFYLNNYARSLIGLDKFEDAEEVLKRAIDISDRAPTTQKDRFFRRKHDLASVYLKTGRPAKALELLNAFKDEYAQALGPSHQDYAQLLKSTAKAHLGVSEVNEGITYLDSSNSVFVAQIDRVFQFRSEKDNKEFMETVIPEFSEFQSLALQNDSFRTQLNEMNLNNQLLQKNLLLSRSRQILDQILESEDSVAIKTVYDYKALKNQLNKIYNQDLSERKIRIDSIEQLINQKETELVKIHNELVTDETPLVKDWNETNTYDLLICWNGSRITNNCVHKYKYSQ